MHYKSTLTPSTPCVIFSVPQNFISIVLNSLPSQENGALTEFTDDGYNGEDRGVAQPGSAPALGAGGRRFESSRPDIVLYDLRP